MSEIVVIGLCGDRLEAPLLERLAGCAAVVLPERLRKQVALSGPELIPVTPVAAMLTAVESALEQGTVMILASGDPLFFGIGRRVIEHFGSGRVRIEPALSALQLACARFRVPWDDLAIVSLHGRAGSGKLARILAAPRTMVLTDPRHRPDRIAALLLERLAEAGREDLVSSCRVRVGENLGRPDERLWSGSLARAARRRFGPLAMMLVELAEGESRPVLGLTEKEIRHSRGLISKDEIRAVLLHQLRLPRQGIFWDVGGGSGSVSLEAAGLAPGLRIFCVERRAEELAHIRWNSGRLRRFQVRAVAGEAPEVLAALPDPDRIFVGGSGGRLAPLVRVCCRRLRPGGRIVISAVLEETAARAPELLARAGLLVESRRVAVTREPGSDRERQLNPITLITGYHE